MDLRVISIGALPAHPLWGEKTQVRTGHATTTLIRSAKRNILVDPGLPEQALVARLSERANLKPTDITDVFLTCFRPDVRRAVTAFDSADWWISEDERDQVGAALVGRVKELAAVSDRPGEDDAKLREALENDVAILKRCRPAPDKFADHVDLFPLPGVTPGMCGLLIAEPRHTTVICGDAIPTIEHLFEGKVLPGSVDLERARQSFTDAIEIADLLVLGRDNLVVNPTRRAF